MYPRPFRSSSNSLHSSCVKTSESLVPARSAIAFLIIDVSRVCISLSETLNSPFNDSIVVTGKVT
jgi:hypothetical protein